MDYIAQKVRTQLLEFATFRTKHPVILDAPHPLVHLFLKHLHERHCNHGVECLRALSQQNFWLLILRSTLGSIQLDYLTCRKRKAETFTLIKVDVLLEKPAFWSPPFSNTKIDFFGPFYVSVKLSTEKLWEFRFTCLNTRAVYLQVVRPMDTSSCVTEFERFASRHGVPGVSWSDYGINFPATEKELLNNAMNWNQQKLTNSLLNKSIKWKFNPVSASDRGGVWERLVRSFKHTFFAILGNRRLADENLSTTFCFFE